MQNHHQGRQRHHQAGMLSSLHERRKDHSRDSGSPLVIKPIAAGTTVAGALSDRRWEDSGKGKTDQRQAQHLIWQQPPGYQPTCQ